MTISEWMHSAETALSASGCPDPGVDARWIAEDVLHMTPTALHFQKNEVPSVDLLAKLNTALKRRLDGEPVQYILGSADFMGLKFYVDGRVLIPRQDTETLVEAVIVELQHIRKPRVLDLCTGSGAIGISVKTLCPKAEVTLADISADALEVARINARGLGAAVTFRHGDLLSAVGDETYDLIASNPPYIVHNTLADLQREVHFEPSLALDGGADGLDFYRRIAKEAGQHLNPGGSIYLEVGAGQADDVLKYLKENIACADSGVLRDLTGMERVVWARLHA